MIKIYYTTMGEIIGEEDPTKERTLKFALLLQQSKEKGLQLGKYTRIKDGTLTFEKTSIVASGEVEKELADVYLEQKAKIYSNLILP